MCKGVVLMSRHLNSVHLIGNLTREPELRYTPNDTAVCEFGLALNHSYQNSDGEWQDETTFVDITVWAKSGENASEYLSKGSRVFIDGRLEFDSWEDSDTGQRRSKLSVTANQVIFLDSQGEPREDNPEDVLDDFDEGDLPEDDDNIPF